MNPESAAYILRSWNDSSDIEKDIFLRFIRICSRTSASLNLNTGRMGIWQNQQSFPENLHYPWNCRPLFNRPPFDMQSLPSTGFMQLPGPDHRFSEPRIAGPRMPYHQNPSHRPLFSPATSRGGSTWQRPFQRNYPLRRRHHLDDIFLPNHDDGEYPEHEEGFHSRHANYRTPIRVEVKTTKSETITKDKTASTSKTHEKVGDPKCYERIITATDPGVKIKDNVEINKQSENNRSCATVFKSSTVSEKKETKTINDKNVTMQKTRIIDKPLERKCETKTNNPENISIPKVSDTGSKQPVNKDETSTKNIILNKSCVTINKERDLKSPIQNYSETKSANQNEINKITKISSSCSEKSDNAKKNDPLSSKTALKKNENMKVVSHLTNTETKMTCGEIRKESDKKQVEKNCKNVPVPEIMGHVDKKTVLKSTSGIPESKKETAVSSIDKSSKPGIRRWSLEGKSKQNKDADKNYESLSDASTSKSKKCISNKGAKIQLFKTDIDKEKLANSKNNEDNKNMQNQKDDKSAKIREKIQEKQSDNKSVNSNKAINNTSNQTPVIQEEIDNDSEMDIVKELEALINTDDYQTTKANKYCEERPTNDSIKSSISSTEAAEKMTEGNLTQDNPTSLPSSPQAIRKDITIKLINSPLAKSPLIAEKRPPQQKSPLPKTPLATNTINKNKELNMNYYKSVSKEPSPETTVSKNASNSLTSTNSPNSNTGLSIGSDADADKNTPILEDIFILEDALKNIDATPEIIEITHSPSCKDSSTINDDNLEDNDTIYIHSTPTRCTADSDDVQIIEEKCDIIEIIDDDANSGSTIIDDGYKKPATPIEVIKIESPEDLERYSKNHSPKNAVEQDRPLEDFRNLDTRGSFLWTFHQRFDDPRTVDMDISSSPPNITAEPENLMINQEQQKSDRVIQNMDALWNEITDNTVDETNNVELKASTESNKANEKKTALTDITISSTKCLQVDRNSKICQTSKKSNNSSVASVQKKRRNKSSKTVPKQNSQYNVEDNLSEKLLPFSKSAKIGDKTTENSDSSSKSAELFQLTKGGKSGHPNLLRRASFSHDSNINSSKAYLRKVKSLDDIVSVSKVNFSHTKLPLVHTMKENLNTVNDDNENSIQNKPTKSKAIIVSEKTISENNLGRNSPIEHITSTPFVDYRDELLSLLSSSGYQDQISDKLEYINKKTTDIGGISKNQLPSSVSNESTIADSDNQKKRKRVRRIDSSDEESAVEKDKGEPKQKKQKIKEKLSRKRKSSLEDKKRIKGPRKNVEVHTSSPDSDKSQEKCSTKVKLRSLPKKGLNDSAPEMLRSLSVQTPTKYVTKAEYVKTFAQNKSLVPNISLSIDPIPKVLKIPQRRATFTCEADNEKILRKVETGARCKQKFLALFGSISDDEDELIQQSPSTETGKTSIDKEKKISKPQIASECREPKNNKTDKKRKRSDTSKEFEGSDTSDSATSKSNQSEKDRTPSDKDGDNCKRIKVHRASSTKSKGKITDEKQISQSKNSSSDKNTKIEVKRKISNASNSKPNVDEDKHKINKDSKRKSSLDSRRTSSSSTDSKSRDDKCQKDNKKKYKEKIQPKIDERISRSLSQDSASSSRARVEKHKSEPRRKSLSKERKIANESDKRETKHKHKLIKIFSKESNDKEVALMSQVSTTESKQKNTTETIFKGNQEPVLSDNRIDNNKGISKNISSKVKTIEELKLRPRDTKSSANPLKRLKESCRRNSAPDVLSSSSETSLVIGEIEDLPLLYRASEGEVTEMLQSCQGFSPSSIKYVRITKIITVDDECIDKVHISKPIETHSDSIKQKNDDDDLIEIIPVIPMIDLTKEDREKSPNESLGDLLEAKIEELVKDQGTITLYRSEEDDGAQVEVQAVSASISMVTRNSTKIKNDEVPQPETSLEDSIKVTNATKNVSNDETPASLNDNTSKEKITDSAKDSLEAASPAASRLFSNLVQNLEITNTSHTEMGDLHNRSSSTGPTETPQPPVIPEVSTSLENENQVVSMSLENENQRAISSILNILQNNQCVNANTDSSEDVQTCTNQNLRISPVLVATAIHTNTVNENLTSENTIQLEQPRINLQQINIASQNHNDTISTKESSVHPTTDNGKTIEQVNLSKKPDSSNLNQCETTALTSERQVSNETSSSEIAEKNKRSRIIIRPTRAEMATGVFIGQGNLDTRLSVVQNQMTQDSFGQHKGLPQALRVYRPVQRTKVTSTFVPPALININQINQISPRENQITQTQNIGVQSTQSIVGVQSPQNIAGNQFTQCTDGVQSTQSIVGIQSTENINGVKSTQSLPENSQLSSYNTTVTGNQVIDLTKDNGNLSPTDKKMIIDIFTRHSFFLAHLCKAQNGYIDYLRQNTFCQNYFRAEILLFEEQKQARLLSQSLRLIIELQNLNIRTTKNLSECAHDIVDRIIYNLSKRDMPKQVTKSMVYLLIAQLMKPQTELFTRIPLFKALIRICNIVIGKMFSKVPVLTKAQIKTLTQQVKEYNRLFPGSPLPGIQLDSDSGISHPSNYVTDSSQSRNQADHISQSNLNSSSGHATLNIRPNNQSTHSEVVSVHQPPGTNTLTPNTIQSTNVGRLDPHFGPPRQSSSNYCGSVLVTNNLSRGPPNVTIRQTGRLQVTYGSPIGPNSPSLNVPMMQQHRFATPRPPSTFALNLVRRAQDLPGGANTNTLGCTPRYLTNYDMPNQSHVYASLGQTRQQPSTQHLSFTSTKTTSVNSSIPSPSVNSQVLRDVHAKQTNLNPQVKSPLLSRLLSDVNSAKTTSTVLTQVPVDQSPRHNLSQSPRHLGIIQSPRHAQNNLHESSPRPPPSYETSIASKAACLSGTPNQLPPEELKKRNENLLNELLFTPDSEPLFAQPSSPMNDNFRIKLPFTQPDATHSITVHTTSANTFSAFNAGITSFGSTTLTINSQPVIPNSPLAVSSQLNLPGSSPGSSRSSPVTYGGGRPKETVVLNQGLAALSSIGPASAMLNSSPQQLQNSQPDANIQASVYYQPVSAFAQTLVCSNEVNQRKSPILIINDSAIMSQSQDQIPVVSYNQIDTLSQLQPSSSPLNRLIENSNQSETPKNYRFRLKSANQSKTKVTKPKAKPKTKPKPKKTTNGGVCKIIETVDLLSSDDDEITSKTQSGEKESETDLVKRAEVQFQVEVSEVVHECIKPSASVIQNVDTAQPSTTQATMIEYIPASTCVTENPVPTLNTPQSSTMQSTVVADVPASTSVTQNQVHIENTPQSTMMQTNIVADVPASTSVTQNQVHIENTPQSSTMENTNTTVADVPASTSATQDLVQIANTPQSSPMQTTTVAYLPASTSDNLNSQSSTAESLSTSVQSAQPSTSNNVILRESVNNEEEAVPIIDLTWIDDLDDQELQREMDFVFIKKEEPRDEDEPAQEPNNMVVPSPADSGIASPPSQAEEDTTVYTVNVQRVCICAATAQYNCACGGAWYCGRDCQLKDWESHEKICQATPKVVGSEEELMAGEQDVDMPE